MRRTILMGVSTVLLALWAVAGLGCTQGQPVDIQTQNVPSDFSYSTTQDVTVKVTVLDVDGNASGGTQVTVGNSTDELVPGNVLLRGITDSQGKFEQTLRVPARVTDLRIQASIMGVSNREDVPIVNNEASVGFGPQS